MVQAVIAKNILCCDVKWSDVGRNIMMSGVMNVTSQKKILLFNGFDCVDVLIFLIPFAEKVRNLAEPLHHRIPVNLR